MTSVAAITDEDIAVQTALDELEAAVAKVRSTQDLTAKRKEEKVARTKLNQVKSQAQAFRNGVQKLEDPTQRSQFNRNYSKYDEKLKNYDKELRNLITAPKGGSAAAKGGAAAKKKTYEDDAMEKIMGEGGADGLGFETAKGVMQAANRAQDDINKSLMRSVKLGQTMKDQTHEMLETLSKQTEKLYQVDKELATLDGELDRAKHQVLWFFRQMAGDRCCLAFMVFLLLGVCGLIFWRLYSNRKPNGPLSLGTTTTTTPRTTAFGETTTTTPCPIWSWNC